MRTQGEIKTELLKLRDLKRMPYSKMAEDSRCSKEQIITALKLEATEPVLRRLDAYLDATHLHVHKKDSDLLYRIEQLDRELYREFQAKSIHILTVQSWSVDRQKRHAAAMDYRLKQLLKERIERDTGARMRFPDGLNYWKCKDYARARGASVGAANRESRRVLRPGAVGKSRFI
jgi:hypothetical protein